MTLEEFYNFAASLNYPALLLGNGQLLPAGRESWFHFCAMATKERLDLAMARLEAMRAKMTESEAKS